MLLLFLSWFLTCNGTKWPKLCLCAVKKLLTHSPRNVSVWRPFFRLPVHPFLTLLGCVVFFFLTLILIGTRRILNVTQQVAAHNVASIHFHLRIRMTGVLVKILMLDSQHKGTMSLPLEHFMTKRRCELVTVNK